MIHRNEISFQNSILNKYKNVTISCKYIIKYSNAIDTSNDWFVLNIIDIFNVAGWNIKYINDKDPRKN